MLSQNPFLPKHWDKSWFDDLDFDSYSTENQSVIKKIINWVKNDNLDNPLGFFITGPTGCGKTHILLSMMKMISFNWFYKNQKALNGQVQYWPYYDLCNYLREEPNDFDRLKKIRTAKFLFIDDIGTSKVTDFIQEKIFSIYDYRCANELATFATTNLGGKQLATEFSERMSSRVKESAIWIELQAKKDFRNTIYVRNRDQFQNQPEVK